MRRACVERGAVPVLLRRRDLLGQAISFRARGSDRHLAQQRRQGRGRAALRLCRAVRAVSTCRGRCSSGPRNFLAMGLDHVDSSTRTCWYDPHPYLDHLAGSLGVARGDARGSRACRCCATTPPRHGAPGFSRMPGRSTSPRSPMGREHRHGRWANLGRFLRKRPMRPFPFAIRRDDGRGLIAWRPETGLASSPWRCRPSHGGDDDPDPGTVARRVGTAQ